MKVHQLLAAISENFGVFASNERRKHAEVQRLEKLAKMGNVHAKNRLQQLEKSKPSTDRNNGRAEKDDADERSPDAVKDQKWKQAKSEVEAAERGSSRAYDRETGSIRPRPPRWNRETRQWE